MNCLASFEAFKLPQSLHSHIYENNRNSLRSVQDLYEACTFVHLENSWGKRIIKKFKTLFQAN